MIQFMTMLSLLTSCSFIDKMISSGIPEEIVQEVGEIILESEQPVHPQGLNGPMPII